MGLFGGFKAKFTRNSRSKDHSEPIVCTKYKINSEFEDDAPVIFKHNLRIRNLKSKAAKEEEKKNAKQQSKSLNDLRNLNEPSIKKELLSPSPVRKAKSSSFAKNSSSSISSNSLSTTRPPYKLPVPIKEQIAQNEYEEPIDSSSSSSTKGSLSFENEKPPPLPKSLPPLNGLIFQNEYDEPDENLYKMNSTDRNTKNSNMASTQGIKDRQNLSNRNLADAEEVITSNSLYLDTNVNSSKSFYNPTEDYEEISPGEEYKVTFPLSERDLEPSTLILMTQPSMDASSFPESPGNFNQTINLFQNENENDFKVNVVQYDDQRNHSLMSEDEISTNELDNEEINSYMSTGYTSQAASIFFGVDMKPQTPKSKKIVLQKATSDEEDC